MTSKAKRIKLELLTPILPDDLIEDLPLLEVFVATIKNPKHISKVVLDLNTSVPIPQLAHLKRVRGKQVLLFPTTTTETISTFLIEKNFDVSLIEEEFEVKKVAKIPPKTRNQHRKIQDLWPCNFHPNSYLENLLTNSLFTDNEHKQHINFMALTLEICKIGKSDNATIIVDSGNVSVVGLGLGENHPIKHSVMMAVDDVARHQKRDVRDKPALYETITKYLHDKVTFGFKESDEGPYLCTGCYVYTINEPCITCAMALVHSRAKRVFYAVPSTIGGLGTLCKVHCIDNLNHHYEVFRLVS